MAAAVLVDLSMLVFVLGRAMALGLGMLQVRLRRLPREAMAQLVRGESLRRAKEGRASRSSTVASLAWSSRESWLESAALGRDCMSQQTSRPTPNTC